MKTFVYVFHDGCNGLRFGGVVNADPKDAKAKLDAYERNNDGILGFGGNGDQFLIPVTGKKTTLDKLIKKMEA